MQTTKTHREIQMVSNFTQSYKSTLKSINREEISNLSNEMCSFAEKQLFEIEKYTNFEQVFTLSALPKIEDNLVAINHIYMGLMQLSKTVNDEFDFTTVIGSITFNKSRASKLVQELRALTNIT